MADVDLPPFPTTGRTFEGTARGGLRDAAPGGRVRLDAIADWLQDVAWADVRQARLEDAALWVVRRARLRVARFPRLGDEVTLRTACSGLGRMWAERRTQVRAGAELLVDAAALWIHLDPASLRPFPLTEAETAVFGPSTAGRVVRARLRHPDPPGGAPRAPWRFRAADCDVAGHVNNAVAWTVLEEDLAAGEVAALDAEVEYRAAALPGAHEIVRDGARRWVLAPDGTVHVSLLVA